MKLLRENTGVYLCDLGLGNSFLDMILKKKSIAAKRKKKEQIGLQNKKFCASKNTSKEVKWQATKGGTYLQMMCLKMV